jgi:hypothetical protein
LCAEPFKDGRFRFNARSAEGKLLGHESLNTTARYTKRTTEQLAEASERLTF